MVPNPNHVLAVFLGADANGGYTPTGGQERLTQAFPRDSGGVCELIEKYLEFPDYPPEEWASNDLAAAAAVYEQRLARAFPELDARCVSALANRWSYSWR